MTKDKAAAIASDVQAVIEAYGSIQGIIHSIFFGSTPPHINVRELSSGSLIRCTYRSSKYARVATALTRRNAIVHVHGLTRTNMIDGRCESLRLEDIELADVMTDDEFESFAGGAPDILGNATLDEFIEAVRGRGEEA